MEEFCFHIFSPGVPIAANHNLHERRLEMLHSRTPLPTPPPPPPPPPHPPPHPPPPLPPLPQPQPIFHSQPPSYLQPVLFPSPPDSANYFASAPKDTGYQQPFGIDPPNSYMTTTTDHYIVPNNYVTTSEESFFKPASLSAQYPLESQPLISPAKPIISSTEYNQQSNQNPLSRSPVGKFEKKLKGRYLVRDFKNYLGFHPVTVNFTIDTKRSYKKLY